MEQFGRLRSAFAGGTLLLAFAGGPAEAGDGQAGGQLLTCAATTADSGTVLLGDLRVGVAANYVRASATVRLSMHDGTVREYALNGRADPIGKQLTPNQASPGFAYPGFACTVQFPGITSVRNCHGSNQRRACEVGVQMFGMPMAFSVSLTAARVQVREARLP